MTVTERIAVELEAIVADRSAPQKHVWRAHIILATAEGCGTAEIMRRSGKSKPVVWRWQAQFMAEGVDGLTRHRTRKPGKQPLPATVVQRVVDLTLGPPPSRRCGHSRRCRALFAQRHANADLPFAGLERSHLLRKLASRRKNERPGQLGRSVAGCADVLA